MSMIFTKSAIGKTGYTLPETAIDEFSLDSVDANLLRSSELDIPELSEKDVFCHYTGLADKIKNNDNGNYVVSAVSNASALDGFTGVHPYQLQDACQGALELLFNTEHMIGDILGMDTVSFKANSKLSAYAELLSVIKAANSGKNITLIGSLDDEILAFIGNCGYTVSADITETTAAVIVSTDNFLTVNDIIAKAKKFSALTVLDMANCRDIIGIARPGDMDFDLVVADFTDLFDISEVEGDSTGALVASAESLTHLMPSPTMDIDELEQYYFNNNRPLSTGKVTAFYGNFTAIARMLAYILSNGFDGLKEISENIRINK